MPSFSFLNTRIVKGHRLSVLYTRVRGDGVHEIPTRTAVLNLPHLLGTVRFMTKVLSSFRLSPPEEVVALDQTYSYRR